MKTIEVDEQLYNYIASQTQHIGESASDILRRLLLAPADDCGTEHRDSVDVNPTISEVTLPHEQAEVVAEAKSTSRNITARKKGNRRKETDSLLVPDVSLDVLLTNDDFTSLEHAISRFLMILAILYRDNTKQFAIACSIKGKKRSYFDQDPQTLEAAGRTTKPRAIPNSPYWVITNVNAARKRLIISQLMDGIGCEQALINDVCDAL